MPENFVPALEAHLGELTGAREIRSATVAFLGDLRAKVMAGIEAGFAGHPRAARDTVRDIASLTDAILIAIHHVAVTRLHPQNTPSDAEKLAILAVGGYGRAEMAPCSDVDLLFLTPWKVTAWAESVVESILYMLWDLKLKVGHATRSIDECLRLGAGDLTIRTSLLEHRHIAGQPALTEELSSRLWADLFDNSVPEFIEAKLAERDDRHRRYGQRYVLEPNVKEGKGGLRDLQTLYWIAKYAHKVNRAIELVGLGFFTAEEHRTFWEAEDFLWAVRSHLHLITGRPTDQLNFDLQVEVARRMGYRDSGGRRAVEHFMQDYFRHATRVGDLTRVFLTELEARHLYTAPILDRILGRRRRRLREGFVVAHGRLNFESPEVLTKHPLNILRIFDEALRTGLLIHPQAMRLITANLGLIDDNMRNDPEAARIFLDLLLKHGNAERSLRRMNELGALDAFIPEFRPVVAMMQFNMYHHYTVDEHLIQCVVALSSIEDGEQIEDLPVATNIMKGDINRRVIYLAVLTHDLGKGREEDHSILGARLARRVVTRLGFNAEEIETVEWLVRNHLLMSDVAQKRDISDPRTIRDFAKAVKTRKRLDMLLVLTVCDIRGVGPSTWNNWKSQLLRQLHRETAQVLESGMEELTREKRQNEAKRALRHLLAAKGWEPKAIRTEAGRHYASYWQGLPTETHGIFADLLADMTPDDIHIDMHPDPDRDATRAAFVMADHPGIFSRLAGALALVGANVVDARTYTSKDGYATAVFWLQDHDGRPYAADRLPRLRNMIERTLRGEVVARDALADRDKVKKREREFKFPTHITFDNEGSDIYTIIEVDTRDRPGLLYDLTRTLAQNHIQIASAVIATYGAQVVDSFYVKDMFGLKLHQAERRAALERKLQQAITEGAERAGN